MILYRWSVYDSAVFVTVHWCDYCSLQHYLHENMYLEELLGAQTLAHLPANVIYM
jgi:hypothetical protein